MGSHRGEGLSVDVADALHDRFYVVKLGLALTDDLGDGVDVLSGRSVVGVAVL